MVVQHGMALRPVLGRRCTLPTGADVMVGDVYNGLPGRECSRVHAKAILVPFEDGE